MKFGYWRGYTDGLNAGLKQAASQYERALAVANEQIAELQHMAAEQSRRADSAVDQLLLRMGIREISSLGVARAEKKIETEYKLMSQLADDPTADRPLGTAGSEYMDPKAASLFPEQDDYLPEPPLQ